MMEVLKMEVFKRSLTKVKRKLALLFILNVLDIVFTLILLKTGLFKEANFIMAVVIDNPYLALFLKVLLVGVLLFLLSKRIEGANGKQLVYSNYIINVMCVIYILINLSHIMWCILYFLIL